MELKQLFADEDAVSPVIGVILMVAITVILAAVIGTFVLGLGENVQDNAPQANFQFEYSTVTVDTDTTDGTGAVDVKEIKITHTGGEDVKADNIEILVDGNPAYGASAYVASDPSVERAFSSGSTISTGSSGAVILANSDSENNPVSVGSTSINDDETGTGLTIATGTAETFTGGETVRVVWTSPSGGTSQTIGSSTVPS